VHVQEVVIKALVAGLAGALRAGGHVAQEAQRGQGAVHRLGTADPALLDADRIGGQGEADRSDAGERTRRIAVRGEPVALVGGVPEELEGAPFDVVEQRRKFGLHRPRRQVRFDQDHLGHHFRCRLGRLAAPGHQAQRESGGGAQQQFGGTRDAQDAFRWWNQGVSRGR